MRLRDILCELLHGTNLHYCTEHTVQVLTEVQRELERLWAEHAGFESEEDVQ